ncbi:MAG: hypothetical protein HFI36_04110 [Bacilli bacterium]|jgi:hypothetical protein|nr:hypothetical protein [Bacilli bacterium]MCX4254961.1 hypothetical protein [Bacilli bacterium]
MKIYLVAGKSGSGKGEVAKLIKKYYISKKAKPFITEYSKYLKMYAKDILNWDGGEPKPRKFLQDIGVTIRENMDMPKMLINRMIEDIKIYDLYYDVVIISDVRYPEEIEEMKKHFNDVKAIYVINQFGPSKLALNEQMHVTETALENYGNFDITLTNDTLDTLDNKIYNYLDSEGE